MKRAFQNLPGIVPALPGSSEQWTAPLPAGLKRRHVHSPWRQSPRSRKRDDLGLAAFRQPAVDSGLSLDQLRPPLPKCFRPVTIRISPPEENAPEMDLAADLADVADAEPAPADDRAS